jgi:hypothetical protein
MEFRLTYAGRLLAHKDTGKLRERSLHVHDIRQAFHKQLQVLWEEHPILNALKNAPPEYHKPPHPPVMKVFRSDGFRWIPVAHDENGLICKLHVLLLRSGRPGKVIYDVDNRVKTLLDALRMARGPKELGAGTATGQRVPSAKEDPFYVLLEDDKLITDVSVTSDMLLDPLPDPTVPAYEAARVVISVTVRPYHPYRETVGYL